MRKIAIEQKVDAAQSPAEELERIRQRLAELERGQKLGLVWRDIPEDVEAKLRDEVPVLVHEKELDVPGANPSDSPHILIEGDNLHALHVLQATHKDKVDVIYIDPPYNRGGDFRYNDKLIDKENQWRHSAWLSFMEKRLRLAHDLLAPSGVLIASIDSVELARLQMLCSSVFGEENIVATLAVVNNLKGRSDDKHIATAHEYAIICARDESQLELRGFGLDEEQASEYKFSDEKGPWKPVGLQKTGKSSLREDRPNLFYPIYWNEKTGKLSLTRNDKSDIKILPIFSDGREGNWRWGKETFEEKADTELVVKRQTRGPVISVKMRLHGDDGEERTLKPKSVWIDPRYDSGSATRLLKEMLGGKVFDNPKPLEYVKDLLKISTGPESTVLDFFAGTGTTLHAAAQLNAEDGGTRHCILVTNNENEICRDVTIPRLKAALTGKWAQGKRTAMPGSLVVYRTDFVKRSKSPDRMRTEIARHTVDLVAVKEFTARTVSRNATIAVLKGAAKTVAVVPGLDPGHAELRKVAENKVEDGDKKIVYLFTWSDHGVEEEVAALWPGWEVNPLPAEMLAALRRLAPPARLFDDMGDE
jgi:adenine-specific DNA-methyltransferase